MDDDQDRADIDTYKGVPFARTFAVGPLGSGRAATCHWRAGTPDLPDGATPVLSVTSDGADLSIVLTPDATAGVVALALTAGRLAGVPAGDYWYELVVLSGGVAESRPWWGWVRHRPTGLSP